MAKTEEEAVVVNYGKTFRDAKRELPMQCEMCRRMRGDPPSEMYRKPIRIAGAHIVPRRWSEDDTRKNLIPLCLSCHNYFDYRWQERLFPLRFSIGLWHLLWGASGWLEGYDWRETSAIKEFTALDVVVSQCLDAEDFLAYMAVI